jgi:hypothetical protein
MRLVERSRKKRSMMLSHDALVGVRCTWNRGCRSSQRKAFGCLWVA